MTLDPTQRAPQDLTDQPMPAIVAQALEQWQGLTGMKMDQRSFRMGVLDLRQMNEILKETLEIEPEGVTALMLLECFLREYLEGKTFTAATIMKDYAATTDWLSKAAELFSVVQSDRATAEINAFRNRVRAGLDHYKVEGADAQEALDDPDLLPFLRRDALKAIESLKPYQFLEGTPGAGRPQVIEHVYVSWNINDLLMSLRDMPVSGIAVVLLRDPANPDRSYFAFAMRNGDRVILFTDKDKPVYPGQEDVLASRGSRGTGRRYMSRAWSNHFPYQLIKTSFDDRGDVVFEDETAPVMAGLKLAPLMRIRDLPPHQAIWLTMMLALIADKFWTKSWTAEALSYTGEMVRKRDMLVTDTSGAKLPVAAGYRPVELNALSVEEVGFEVMKKQVRGKYERNNAWLEERYASSVNPELLNLWFSPEEEVLILPTVEKRDDKWSQRSRSEGLKLCTPAPGGAVAVPKAARSGFNSVAGYELLTFAQTDFGTEAELAEDRIFVARHNLARHIQKAADQEFEDRKAEVASWFFSSVKRNLDGILEILAREINGEYRGKWKNGEQCLGIMLSEANSDDWKHAFSTHNTLGDKILGQSYKYACALTGVASTKYRAKITPYTSEDIALLVGGEVSDLPDVLQHYTKREHYSGNHLLDRIDPVESRVESPWLKLDLSLQLRLSLTGYKRVQALAETLKATA